MSKNKMLSEAELIEKYSPPSDEIDLSLFFQEVIASRFYVIATVIVFLVCAFFYSINLHDEYKSSIILTPSTSSGSSSLSKLAGQFGGLASLAGVNLSGSDGADKLSMALEILKTWDFQESFIKYNKLELEVFAYGWNRETDELLIDDSIYDSKNKIWIGEFQNGGPSGWQLHKKFKDKVSVSNDSKTGIVTLTVEHVSPIVAQKWARLIVDYVNKQMQLKDRREALESIEYLKKQIQKTSIAEMSAIFYQLIEEQTKTLMLADISEEYVLKTLSPARVAEEKSKPKRPLIIFLGGVLGFFASMLIVFYRYFFI